MGRQHRASSPGVAKFLHAGGVIIVVPVVNPDGYANNTRENSRGQDLNRDFDLLPTGEPHFKESESKALALRDSVFVEAARASGASTPRILLRHVAPNCLGPLIVKASMDMGFAILAAASLGFIGLGARPPAPEWGAMMAVARNYMPGWWWYSLAPGAFVFATVLGFNLLGDGLATWLDPREASR